MAPAALQTPSGSAARRRSRSAPAGARPGRAAPAPVSTAADAPLAGPLVDRHADRAGGVGAPDDVGRRAAPCAASPAAPPRLPSCGTPLLQVARLDPEQLQRVGRGAEDRLGNGGGGLHQAAAPRPPRRPRARRRRGAGRSGWPRWTRPPWRGSRPAARRSRAPATGAGVLNGKVRGRQVAVQRPTPARDSRSGARAHPSGRTGPGPPVAPRARAASPLSRPARHLLGAVRPAWSAQASMTPSGPAAELDAAAGRRSRAGTAARRGGTPSGPRSR